MDINYLMFWGVFGLMMELCFTALRDLIQKKQLNLMGHTSLWMFPVYALGLSYGFDFVIGLVGSDLLRYIMYPFWIWAVELAIGIPALYFGLRLWDYHYLPRWLHWRGIVSYAHYPLWMGFCIMVEMIK